MKLEIIEDITIPSSVTAIGDYAFGGNYTTELVLKEGLVEIEYEAFIHQRLKSLTIPSSVTTIAGAAFSFPGDLAKVTIGADVGTYKKDADGSWQREK